jgi:hypothetical protein
MAKLYELIKYRNDLVNALDELDLTSTITDKICRLSIIADENKNSTYLADIKSTVDEYQAIQEKNQLTLNKLKESISQLNEEIDLFAKTEFSSEFYNNNWVEGRNKFHLLPIDDELKVTLINRITHYSDWHYAGLQIMPRNEEWIAPMVGCDPLYLTAYYDPTLWEVSPGMKEFDHHWTREYLDTFESYEIYKLKELIKDYPEPYQRRVRLYNIKDRDFRILPKEQFGFVLCWDNFDYLTFNKIEIYIKEVFRLLRPGGVFMFSYTNCELLLSADKAESWNAGYCSSTWLIKLFAEIGYEVIRFSDQLVKGDRDSYVSWVEVRKPGELKTIKLHQTMGEIIDVNLS